MKGIYANSLAYVRVKGGESECFRIDSGLKQEYVMSLSLFNAYMDAGIKEVKIGMWRRGESGYCVASCMQMTWFCVVSRRFIFLRCVGEEV